MKTMTSLLPFLPAVDRTLINRGPRRFVNINNNNKHMNSLKSKNTFCTLLILALSMCLAARAHAGRLFVAEQYNGNVDAIDTVSGQGEVVASGLGGMIGAAVDRKGRLFVFRYDAQAVAQVDPVAHTFVDIVTGINGHGLFADPDSDTLYLAGYGDGKVYRISESATSPGRGRALRTYRDIRHR
jgi:sugar lactone lactonase YvrE